MGGRERPAGGGRLALGGEQRAAAVPRVAAGRAEQQPRQRALPRAHALPRLQVDRPRVQLQERVRVRARPRRHPTAAGHALIDLMHWLLIMIRSDRITRLYSSPEYSYLSHTQDNEYTVGKHQAGKRSKRRAPQECCSGSLHMHMHNTSSHIASNHIISHHFICIAHALMLYEYGSFATFLISSLKDSTLYERAYAII